MNNFKGIGVAAIVLGHEPDDVLAIHCAKGRGLILPGGKPNPGESLFKAVQRELFEETGVNSSVRELFFQGMTEEGWYMYFFLMYRVPEQLLVASVEGKPRFVNWNYMIQNSNYSQILELVWDKYHDRIGE